MDYTQYAMIMLTLVIGYYINMNFRLKNKNYGSDSWFHLLMSEEVRKNRFRFPKEVPHYILGKTYDYPPFIHYMIALIPIKHQKTIAPIMQQLVDIAIKLIVFQTTYTLTGNFYTSLIALIIYTTTIISSQESVEPNPRTHGALVYFMTMLSLYSYSQTNDPTSAILAVIFTGILCITHRFGIQTLSFTTIALSLYYRNPIYLITTIAGIITAMIATRGHYKLILESHIKQLIFWKKVFKDNLQSGKKAGINRNLIYTYEMLISNNWDIIAIMFLALGYGPKIQGTNLEFIVIWMIMIRLISILVQTFRELKHIGEGHRYLAYSALPSAVIVSIILMQENSSILWAIFALTIIINIIALRIWQKKIRSKKDMYLEQDSLETFETIKNRKEKTILVFPNTLSRTVAYFTRKDTLITVSPQHFKHILPLYWNIEDLKSIIERHKPDMVLIMNNIKSGYNTKDLEEIETNNTYTLYKTNIK